MLRRAPLVALHASPRPGCRGVRRDLRGTLEQAAIPKNNVTAFMISPTKQTTKKSRFLSVHHAGQHLEDRWNNFGLDVSLLQPRRGTIQSRLSPRAPQRSIDWQQLLLDFLDATHESVHKSHLERGLQATSRGQKQLTRQSDLWVQRRQLRVQQATTVEADESVRKMPIILRA